MAKTYEASGKTVDEAIDNACVLAGTTIENVEIEILELGGKGLFGFGHKDARVRITVEEPEPLQDQRPATTFSKKKPKAEQKKPQPASEELEIKPIMVVEPPARPKRQQPAKSQPRQNHDQPAAIKSEPGAKAMPR